MSKTPRSPLRQMVETTPTDYWNDSCATEELRYAIAHGAVGATSNPTIVHQVLQQEFEQWKAWLDEAMAQQPTLGEEQLAWRLIEEMAIRGAKLLQPVFERSDGRMGRLSVQTHAAWYRNAEAIGAQAQHFSKLAPNIQVKIPATAAGIQAIEESTARGVNINATVCFTVPQAIAVAEAVELGLKRLEASGRPKSPMTPVCTIMVGRLDDWLKVVAERDGIIVTPAILDWAGIACIKRAHAIYQQRGYRTRLLSAAYRHHLHWSELIGGDIVQTIPCAWAKRFNASDVAVTPRFAKAVDPAIIGQLQDKFADFCRAYEPNGLDVEAFDSYGATVRTLRGFISSYQRLVAEVRDLMLPNPDTVPQ